MRTRGQSVQIESLATHPEWVDLLAGWHVAEWHWLYPGWTPEVFLFAENGCQARRKVELPRQPFQRGLRFLRLQSHWGTLG